ncbi:MarR family transcriptional regulator [Romboutsia weinsteinii]|uniref:MarR family transcriptional regulator n=1 Tax=Romboutsia weinsteinii TaxID=2020949 RepID=A0A371J9I7_9FIRM|nr:MarR family transcriptional regulator [Romboutsia weinsteinii]RDY29409.1 MarR family transcriptional regulator [Romboutsia weinsteinii]
MEKERAENIGKYISFIYRKGGGFISRGLSDIGLGFGQLMFLLELYRADGKSQEDLCELLNIDKGTTARAIKKLEEESFVIRFKDEHDKRAYNIYLTEKAKELKPSVFKVLDNWNEIITQGFEESEKELTLELLKRICRNASSK